jgi:hypothetical protein
MTIGATGGEQIAAAMETIAQCYGRRHFLPKFEIGGRKRVW